MTPVNLVLVISHDTGRQLSPYGASVETPNLQRMAEEGALFRQAFCASPGCSSSRVAMMTSTYPHQNGMVGLAHRGFRMENFRHHLSWVLRERGYRTHLAGLQHEVIGPELDQLGYETTETDLPWDSAERGRAAADWIGEHAQSADDRPFFLALGLMETHREFGPVESPYDERYVAPLPWLPDDPQVRRDLAELNSAVTSVDRGMGHVLDALEGLGLKENTLVIFTTDHGVPFPRAKATLFDAGIGVALVMRGSGGFAGGKVTDALVNLMDLPPTFMELAGLDAPDWYEGVSLMPLVRGDAESVHEEVFSEITYHAAYDPARCIRTARFKLIEFFEDYPRLVWPNVDDGFSKEVMHEAGLPQLKRDRAMLFDLVADPQEFENLVERPEYKAEREHLAGRLKAWMLRTDDRILRGPWPLPEGGKTNPVDQYSPD